MIIKFDSKESLEAFKNSDHVLGKSFKTIAATQAHKLTIWWNPDPTDKHIAKGLVGVPCYHKIIEFVGKIQYNLGIEEITISGIIINVKDGGDNFLPSLNKIKNVIGCKATGNLWSPTEIGFIGPDIILAGSKGYSTNKKKTFKIPKSTEYKSYPKIASGMLLEPPRENYSEHVRSVYGAVFTFYALEEISLRDNLPPFFESRFSEFVETTARTMFDYLASICITEARHAHGVHWNMYEKSGGKKSRSESWKYQHKYNPAQFLQVCSQLFNESSFPGGYGGTKWAKIADSALKYFTLPRKTWFDHVVDLSHNGGLAFNKGVFWFHPSSPTLYLEMLSKKKKGSILDGGSLYSNLESTLGEMKWLLYCVGLADEPGPSCPPMAWGDEEIVINMPDNGGDVESDDWEETSATPKHMRVAKRII